MKRRATRSTRLGPLFPYTALFRAVAARRWMRALARRHLDRRHHAEVANVDDVRQALQRMDRVLEIGCQVRGALEQALLGIDVQRRDRKSVVSGKSVSVRVDLGGRRIIKKKKNKTKKKIP